MSFYRIAGPPETGEAFRGLPDVRPPARPVGEGRTVPAVARPSLPPYPHGPSFLTARMLSATMRLLWEILAVANGDGSSATALPKSNSGRPCALLGGFPGRALGGTMGTQSSPQRLT